MPPSSYNSLKRLVLKYWVENTIFFHEDPSIIILFSYIYNRYCQQVPKSHLLPPFCLGKCIKGYFPNIVRKKKTFKKHSYFCYQHIGLIDFHKVQFRQWLQERQQPFKKDAQTMTDIVIPILKRELVNEIVEETPTDFPMVKIETVVPLSIVKSELVDEIVEETPTDFPIVKTEIVVPVDKTPGSFYAEIVKETPTDFPIAKTETVVPVDKAPSYFHAEVVKEKKKLNVCTFIMKDLSILMMIIVIKL